MERRRIVTVGLCLIAVLPIVVGSIQILHYIYWLFGLSYETVALFVVADNTMPFLAFAFFISLLEKFCFYHRLVICATLYTNSSYLMLGLFPSILLYNITNMLSATLIVVGIIGCMTHFIYQIYDFKRYIRIRREKQAAH